MELGGLFEERLWPSLSVAFTLAMSAQDALYNFS